jgi:hypothetical protein
MMRKRNMKARGNGTKTVGPRARDGVRQLIPHPPQLGSYGITHSTKLRFIVNAAVSQTVITFQNLLDAINIATSATTASQLFATVRIRSVEMWAAPVIGNATTVQCEFAGASAGLRGDSNIHTDTSMGIEPAHVLARPASMSGAAFFQTSGAMTAMTFTCPSGTVIDVALTYRGLPGTATATQNVPVAATTGAWYYRGLDGLAIATTVFVPVINASGSD